MGPVVLRAVESVRPDEPVQQGARVGVRPFVADGDQRDYEVRVREIGIPGEVGDAGLNASVGHRVLVGVVPPVGHFQRLDGVDAAVIGDLDDGPVLPGAGEGRVRCSVWLRYPCPYGDMDGGGSASPWAQKLPESTEA